MRSLRRGWEELAYVADELINNHTLRVFGLEVTTENHATRRAHTAFRLGVDAGRCGYELDEDEPRPARVLQLVGTDQ